MGVEPAETPILVPFVAGEADLELLRTVSPWVPASMEDHLAAIEEGGRLLAEAGSRVDLVPVWAPLFLVWCEEHDVDPASADALERWANRNGLISVIYTHYECGPIEPLVDLEHARSWALRVVLADPERRSERMAAVIWGMAAAFLEAISQKAGDGSELDVVAATMQEHSHWHVDGSSCEGSSPTLDHVHASLMEALAVDGTAVLAEPGVGDAPAKVRVWRLGSGGVTPLTAGQAAQVCQAEGGAVLVDAWGAPAHR